jgi:hypothetical protein
MTKTAWVFYKIISFIENKNQIKLFKEKAIEKRGLFHIKTDNIASFLHFSILIIKVL